MQNTVLLISFVLFLGLLLFGGYSFLYTREVLRLEKNIGVTIPPFIHTMLKSITMLAFFFGFLGICATLFYYFFQP